MPVCLYDGNAYSVEKEFENMEHSRELMLRSEALMFFLDGHKEDIIVVYDSVGNEKGYITYKSLTESSGIADAVMDEKLWIGDDMWDNAGNMLGEQADKILPVYNKDKEMLYFAKYVPALKTPWYKLDELRECIDKIQWRKFRDHERHIHIVGINDVLFWLRRWLRSVGAMVSVEGEWWQYFGIEEEKCTDADAIIVDEGCGWIEELHAEYRSWIQEEISELKKLLLKPYEKTEEKDKVMFLVPSYAYFISNVVPLIYKYLHSGKTCVIVFAYLESIISAGRENILKTIKIIKDMEAVGGRIYSRDEKELYKDRYSVCFLCCEYSPFPDMLRNRCEYVVSLQASAIYVHMHVFEGRFEKVFSDKAEKEIDYLVASDYFADWVCGLDSRWKDKTLKLGYPKLDTLYRGLASMEDIPEEWEKKIAGKKVILFAVNMNKIALLEKIAEEEDCVLMLRPHPIIFQKYKDRLNQLCEKYHNIIIEQMESYHLAFKVSDALIVDRLGSIMVNYLYTENPVCLYESEDVQYAIDYRQEAWYKSAYIATKKREVLEFVRMVQNGEDTRKQEMVVYRRRMISNFDGKVCDRIYDFMEKTIGT